MCVFNRTVSKVNEFVNREKTRKNLCGAMNVVDFVACLSKPRKVMLLVKAGQAVDDLIETLVGLFPFF